MYKKYLVIYGVDDWYDIYTGYVIVKARTEKEAERKAMKKIKPYETIFDIVNLEEV